MISTLHLLNALIGIGIGLYCLFWSSSAAASLGIVFEHPSGLTDFRATYGGMVLACGLFFFLAYLGVISDNAALWLSVLFYAGLGFTRLVGLIIERPQMPMMYGFCILEMIFFCASVLLLLL